jgi:hypothetical protein
MMVGTATPHFMSMMSYWKPALRNRDINANIAAAKLFSSPSSIAKTGGIDRQFLHSKIPGGGGIDSFSNDIIVARILQPAGFDKQSNMI